MNQINKPWKASRNIDSGQQVIKSSNNELRRTL